MRSNYWILGFSIVRNHLMGPRARYYSLSIERAHYTQICNEFYMLSVHALIETYSTFYFKHYCSIDFLCLLLISSPSMFVREFSCIGALIGVSAFNLYSFPNIHMQTCWLFVSSYCAKFSPTKLSLDMADH